jgi:hypothetical protein
VNPSTSLLSSISSEDLELDVVEWVRDSLLRQQKRSNKQTWGIVLLMVPCLERNEHENI